MPLDRLNRLRCLGSKVNRLPLLLAQALGDAFPEDAAQRVLTLSTEAPGGAPQEARVATKVTLDPLLLSGSLAMTAQATQLLPLRGFDGHILARQGRSL